MADKTPYAVNDSASTGTRNSSNYTDSFNVTAELVPFDRLDGDVPLEVPRARVSEDTRGEPGYRRTPTARLKTAAMYRGIADFFDIEPGLVYHPAPRTQVAPSAAFPDANVLYVDLESNSTDRLTEHGYLAIPGDADEFDLEEELSTRADVIIYYDATNVDLEAATEGNLADDGWIISDERYQTADVLDNLEIHAKVRFTDAGSVEIDAEDLHEYYEAVESEEEYRERHPRHYKEKREEVDERIGEDCGLIDGLREIERLEARNRIHNSAINERRKIESGDWDVDRNSEDELGLDSYYRDIIESPEAPLPRKKIGAQLTVFRKV